MEKEKHKFRVDLGATADVYAVAYVEAADEDEAKNLAVNNTEAWVVDLVDQNSIEVFNVTCMR